MKAAVEAAVEEEEKGEDKGEIDQNGGCDEIYARKSFNAFKEIWLPSPKDLHACKTIMNCIHFVCYEIAAPPIHLILDGPVYHFFCRVMESKNEILINNLIPTNLLAFIE